MKGGYDEGYEACPCFWGREPGSLVKLLRARVLSLSGLNVLDAGCGEGKNAAYLARCGARVRAVDISGPAIANAERAWGDTGGIIWEVADIRNVEVPLATYDVVLAYGLLHCLPGEQEVRDVAAKLQAATKTDGYNVVCAFNSRHQELTAHPGFQPCLLDHIFYAQLYASWEIIELSDSDLIESHPHNNIVHTHSLTRLVARRLV